MAYTIIKNDVVIENGCIVKYLGIEKNIVIPEYIDGQLVKSIGDYAFACNQLKNVVISNSVTVIGDCAFRYNKLTNVVISNSVTVIGDSAFYSNKLKNVVIPDSVTVIGDCAFACNQLKNVVIPDSVTVIGDHAIAGNQLTSAVISDSVAEIGDCAFYSNKLTNAVIPNSVTEIGDCAFERNLLTSVVISNSVAEVGAYAFSDNELKNVLIPDSVKKIGAYAFYDNKLTNAVIPDSVTDIGARAFDHNEDLKNIKWRDISYPVRYLDGYLSVIDKTYPINGITMHKCRYFGGSFDKHYIAEKGDYVAHGNTSRDAINDLNFKILSENFEIDEVVNLIKQTGRINKNQYRLLTGACSMGVDKFIKQNEKFIKNDQMKLDDMIKMTENHYGHSRIVELFK